MFFVNEDSHILLFESVCEMNTTFLPYIVMEVFCIIFSVLLLTRLKYNPDSGNEVRILRIMFIFNIIMLAADILWALIESDFFHPPVLISMFINAVEDISVSCGCYFWFRFADERLHYSFAKSRTAAILFQIPVLAVCVLDIISIFTGWLFYIDEENLCTETSLFLYTQSAVNFFYMAIPAVLSVIRMIQTRSKRKRAEYLCYVLYIFGCSFSLYCFYLIKTIPFFALTVFTALLILFLVIYADREEERLKEQQELTKIRAAGLQKEQELTKARTAVMISRIQPHFLYNALAAIQDLCHGKAPEAEQAIVQFSEFLRGNMDSLGMNETIPFTQELEHTRNYLLLEQRRFGERLHVEYDIQSENFRIPALTLQPMAENAVRYGVTKKESGSTVRISTRETENAFFVVVEDDGLGFDPNAPNPGSRTHIGITNVRQRLKAMCGGSLTVTSILNCGTTAVISIPKETKP